MFLSAYCRCTFCPLESSPTAYSNKFACSSRGINTRCMSLCGVSSTCTTVGHNSQLLLRLTAVLATPRLFSDRMSWAPFADPFLIRCVYVCNLRCTELCGTWCVAVPSLCAAYSADCYTEIKKRRRRSGDVCQSACRLSAIVLFWIGVAKLYSFVSMSRERRFVSTCG